MNASREKRVGRPLEAERHGERGGDNPIPRSFGLTLEVLRESLNEDEAGMLRRIIDEDSDYDIKTYSTKQRSMEATVRSWETAEREPPFGVLHRYGLISDTWCGVLHLISLFCADLRDATDDDAKSSKLENVKLVADRLMALAIYAKGLADNFDRDETMKALAGSATDDPVRMRAKTLIGDLLTAYRCGKRIEIIAVNGDAIVLRFQPTNNAL